jgi:prepilin-type N-terminal cleavage/methylation domain-containing protein
MKKGFTLLELLIVIGILAILSTTMILVINPAEMLKKARDSQRISDLNNLKSAISLYLTDVSNPSFGSSTYVYISNGLSITSTTATACGPSVIGANNAITTSSQSIYGTGWIPISFASISGGSPISAEPVDPNPSNSSPYRFYLYIPSTSTNTFELMANMESVYYSTGSTSVEASDGGSLPNVYELGTQLFTPQTSTNCYGGGT